MSVPALHLPSHYDAYISGEVIIHPSAAIAPGVIMQARKGSRIVVAAGACVGMGVILQVHEGNLEIGEGVSLGAGVLVIGESSIGENACIGASTTIYHTSIEAGQIVPAGSLIGDVTRPPEQLPVAPEEQLLIAPEELQVTDTVILPSDEEVVPAEREEPPLVEPEPDASPSPTPAPQSGVNVYGKMYVNQLLVKLMPNREVDIQPTSTNPSLPADPWDE